MNQEVLVKGKKACVFIRISPWISSTCRIFCRQKKKEKAKMDTGKYRRYQSWTDTEETRGWCSWPCGCALTSDPTQPLQPWFYISVWSSTLSVLLFYPLSPCPPPLPSKTSAEAFFVARRQAASQWHRMFGFNVFYKQPLSALRVYLFVNVRYRLDTSWEETRRTRGSG